MSTISAEQIFIAPAQLSHLNELLILENECFTCDQLSRRSFKRFLTNPHCVFLVALDDDKVVAYSLIIFHRGTRLARLYSMAVSPHYRGYGLARLLMEKGEIAAQDKGAFYYRLEVNTKNIPAINLYRSLGFKEFKFLKEYYEDNSDAMRMKKRIKHYQHPSVEPEIPWIQQNTPFTCGPASLMMALSALDPLYQYNLEEELEIWREATTIFMTSGHGGCHPLGLANAAKTRGFNAKVWINHTAPLFVDGVRSEEKKNIISTVHHHFVKQSHDHHIDIIYDNITAERLKQACDNNEVPIILISTYRMDNKKAPHWVVVSGYDDTCFYLHDPDTEDALRDHMDCQYIPVAFDDFERMSVFGRDRTRTSVIISMT